MNSPLSKHLALRHQPLHRRIGHAAQGAISRSPARFALTVFSSLIIVFSFLLSLPLAAASGEWTNPVTAFFTAVSVVCVTGLAVVNMAEHWSLVGEIIIFIGVQIGALGVLTLASSLGLIFAGKLGLKAKLRAASDSNPMRIRSGPVSESQEIRLSDVGGLLLTITVSTLIIEVVIAALLLPRFLSYGLDALEAIWHSAFYAAMSFTNTGFTPNAEGLGAYNGDAWIMILLSLAVILGSLGFPVIFAFIRHFRKPKHWSLHVKLTVTVTAILLFGGTALFLMLELGNAATFGTAEPGDMLLQAFFLSSMTRSGGFSTIDIEQLTGASRLAANMWMFIGGGSASTAGGIKVTTLAILFLAVVAEAKGKKDIEAFDRRIPHDVLRIAVSVLFLSATTICATVILLLALGQGSLDDVLFDTISAFGTVGLSTGYTAAASEIEQIILALTMVIGRIGTITLSVALLSSSRIQRFRRPEERPIIG